MASAKKRTTGKKVTTKKSSPKKVSKAQLKSFQLSKEKCPFMSFRITDQTVYWSILLIMILLLSLWVLNIQINISEILDNINKSV